MGRRVRHTAHFYLATAGYVLSLAVVVLNLWAYYDERLLLTEIAFGVLAVTILDLFITWFWGVYLLMSGVIVRGRLPYLLFHVTLGSISPLLFTIGLGFQIDTLGTQPVGDLEVELEILAWLVLTIQLVSGWVMLQRGPWRRNTYSRS